MLNKSPLQHLLQGAFYIEKAGLRRLFHPKSYHKLNLLMLW
jgi:hypothetical protein